MLPASTVVSGNAGGLWGRLTGKIGGAGLGLVLGGPIGALLGSLAGHVLFDRDDAPFGVPSRSFIFTTGLVALSAKMARSDGVVTRDEVAAFRRLIDGSPADLARIEALFDLAKGTSLGFEPYADQLGRAFTDEQALLEDVLDCLFQIAAADGVVHEAETRYLADVARLFGLAAAAFEQIEARHVRRGNDPYAVLGASRAMSVEAIRVLYLALVSRHHPDRAIARGLPPEAVSIANARMAVINAAWATIQGDKIASDEISSDEISSEKISSDKISRDKASADRTSTPRS